MSGSRNKLFFQSVAPAILSNACVFLFSVVDGIFVGNGAGSQALGAVKLNTVRSLVMNSLVITFLPKLFGSAIVWHTFGIYEVLVLVIALALKKTSEKNGISYQ